MKDIVGVIPARYKSSRFPGKPLAMILGVPMVIRVCRIVESALGKENTFVATDDERILREVERHGYQAVMTSENCLTGTDRLWDFAQQIKANIYVNIQGDEPMLNPKDILSVAKCKKENMDFIVNGMCDIGKNEDPCNINIPKVLVNNKNELIYMSRLAIPGIKDLKRKEKPNYKKQVCIYGFSYEDLKKFGTQKFKATYEKYEDIEILRFFDLDTTVKMIETSGSSLAVDEQSDVEKVENALRLKTL